MWTIVSYPPAFLSSILIGVYSSAALLPPRSSLLSEVASLEDYRLTYPPAPLSSILVGFYSSAALLPPAVAPLHLPSKIPRD